MATPCSQLVLPHVLVANLEALHHHGLEMRHGRWCASPPQQDLFLHGVSAQYTHVGDAYLQLLQCLVVPQDLDEKLAIKPDDHRPWVKLRHVANVVVVAVIVRHQLDVGRRASLVHSPPLEPIRLRFAQKFGLGELGERAPAGYRVP